VPNRFRYAAGVCAAVAMLTNAGIAAAPADEITAYTSYEEDELAAFLEAMKEDLPDLQVNVPRLSTGTSPPARWPRPTTRSTT
jgi:hypothetical protein